MSVFDIELASFSDGAFFLVYFFERFLEMSVHVAAGCLCRLAIVSCIGSKCYDHANPVRLRQFVS